MASPDPQQLSFESPADQCSIVISVTGGLKVPADKLEGLAREFARERIQTEVQQRKIEELRLSEPVVDRKAEDLIEVSYSGFDPAMSFHFLAVVTPRKVLSAWTSSARSGPEVAAKLGETVIRGLRVYVP